MERITSFFCAHHNPNKINIPIHGTIAAKNFKDRMFRYYSGYFSTDEFQFKVPPKV